jgi:predicted PurR-regulated permease PerM
MATIGDRERVTQVVFYGALLLIGYLVFRIVQPFLAPLGWSGVLAVCAYPLHARLVPRVGATRAAIITTALVIIWLIVPAWLLTLILVREGSQAVDVLQRSIAQGSPEQLLSVWDWVRINLPFLEPERLSASLGDIGKAAIAKLASGSGAVLGGVAVWLLQLAITLFALFFFLRDSRTIVGVMRWFLPFDDVRKDHVLRQIQDLIFASVVAGVAIAALQGVIAGAAFGLLGIPGAVVWGTVMAFLSLVPMLGSWLVWVPVAIWLLATGEVTRGLILVGVGTGLVGSVDNVLRPMLLSGRSAMNGLVMLVSLLGGVAAFGFIGIILGPVVVAVATALLQAYLQPPPLMISKEPAVERTPHLAGTDDTAPQSTT